MCGRRVVDCRFEIADFRFRDDSLIADLQVLDIRDRDAVRFQTLRENRFVRS